MTSSSPGTRCRPTKPLYDSRAANNPGIGFPSLCTDLVRAPRNTRDPHDYYAELGVDPSASVAEIRRAARRLYVELHPDTGRSPDPDRLTRVRNIVDVLTDDAERFKYDNTPDGQRLNDKVYREQLSRLDAGVVRTIVAETPRAPSGRFDYFGLGHKTTDALKAQQWYHFLIANLVPTTYQGRLRLLLWDASTARWDPETEVVMVPRTWEPSAFAARFLLTRVVGGGMSPS